jgi:hypothetical protein
MYYIDEIRILSKQRDGCAQDYGYARHPKYFMSKHEYYYAYLDEYTIVLFFSKFN